MDLTEQSVTVPPLILFDERESVIQDLGFREVGFPRRALVFLPKDKIEVTETGV